MKAVCMVRTQTTYFFKKEIIGKFLVTKVILQTYEHGKKINIYIYSMDISEEESSLSKTKSQRISTHPTAI